MSWNSFQKELLLRGDLFSERIHPCLFVFLPHSCSWVLVILESDISVVSEGEIGIFFINQNFLLSHSR